MKKLAFAVTILAASCAETPLQRADNDFDVTVAKPAFKNGPVLLFDEGHNNFHTSEGLYAPFINLARNDGFAIRVSKEAITPGTLTGARILVIANAKGQNDLSDEPAFTPQECRIISDWVRGGGSLLLIADHFPFGSAVQLLGDAFGVQFQKGMVEDSIFFDKASNDHTQLEFTRGDGTLQDHPITRGVNRVVSFTGQSIRCKDSCTYFLGLSPAAVDLRPVTHVEKDGADTRVQVNYEPAGAAGNAAQGIASNFGSGRIVVLGEAAMLTAQKNRANAPVGMNYNAGNKQLALNILHWLSKLE
jgi:hypothetical protein